MERITLALIGIGEAGLAQAGGLGDVAGYDTKLNDDRDRCSIEALARAAMIEPKPSNASTVAGAGPIFRSSRPIRRSPSHERRRSRSRRGALLCDMNSVAPDTKRAVAAAIEAAGGRYVDIAEMAPVHPLRGRWRPTS